MCIITIYTATLVERAARREYMSQPNFLLDISVLRCCSAVTSLVLAHLHYTLRRYVVGIKGMRHNMTIVNR